MKSFSFLLLLAVALATFGAGPQSARAQEVQPAAPSCANLLANGDMEDDAGWLLDSGATAASYANNGRGDGADGGGQALLLASEPPAAGGQPRWVSAIQKVELPADAPAELSLWYELEAGQSEQPQTQIALLDEEGQLLRILASGLAPADSWTEATADLSAYAGETVQIYIAAVARGTGGPVSLLVDDVVLCDPASVAAGAPAAAPAGALTATAPRGAVAADPESVVSFRDLQIDTLTLSGPSDTAAVSFRLPADWQVGEGAAIQLALQAAVLNERGGAATDSLSGSVLEVRLNNTLLRAVPIDQTGPQVASVPLPAELLASPNAPQRLAFQLKGGLSCLASQQLRVAVGGDSQLLLPHTTAPIAPSLATLPSPIVQRALAEDRATIVVADQPSAGELQAALTAAAALGRMSEGDLALDLTTIGQLDEERRETSNLIVVGTDASLQALAGLPRSEVSGASAGDGVVQIAASPWNPSLAVLILGGQDEAGVVKAGKAFSSDSLAAGSQGSTAIISDVNAQPAVRRVSVDRTLELLGYDARTISGSDAQTLRYRFVVPSGAAVSGDAYLNLVFNHSAGLDFDSSSAVVSVNGQPIGTVALDESTTQISTLRITIPRSVARSGQNELAIAAQMNPRSDCVAAGENDLWMTVWPESLLHLPVNPAESGMGTSPSPSDYPAPFSFDAGLGETALVLPQEDSAAWATAARIAFDLGQQAQGEIIDLSAHFSDTIDEETVGSRNLILVGRAETLPIVERLNGQLGIAGGDAAGNIGSAVSYRLSENAEIGKVEAITSPWNDQRTLLAVFGDSDAGLQQAAAALTDPELRQRMSGSLALVNAGQVIAGEPRASAEAAPGAAPESSAPPADLMAVPEFQRPGWILPTIALSALLIVAILGYVVFSTLNQSRSRR